MKVGIIRLGHAQDLPLPHYATVGSAGLDLLAAVDQEIADCAKLADRVRDLMKQYERPDPAERPEGARRIQVVFRGVPRVEPKRKKGDRS